MKPEEILELYDELGRPSTAKFARALRKRGMKITDEDVQKNVVGLQGERQLRAPSPRYRGKIFSLRIDEKWVADIMVIPPGRHALIVQDVVVFPGSSGLERWTHKRTWSRRCFRF